MCFNTNLFSNIFLFNLWFNPVVPNLMVRSKDKSERSQDQKKKLLLKIVFIFSNFSPMFAFGGEILYTFTYSAYDNDEELLLLRCHQQNKNLGTTGFNYPFGNHLTYPGSWLRQRGYRSVKNTLFSPCKHFAEYSTSSTYLYRVVRHRCPCCSLFTQFAVSQTTCAHVGFVPHVDVLFPFQDSRIKR